MPHCFNFFNLKTNFSRKQNGYSFAFRHSVQCVAELLIASIYKYKYKCKTANALIYGAIMWNVCIDLLQILSVKDVRPMETHEAVLHL